eukprot:5891769-Pleurochrysis_carterae.AAC.1
MVSAMYATAAMAALSEELLLVSRARAPSPRAQVSVSDVAHILLRDLLDGDAQPAPLGGGAALRRALAPGPDHLWLLPGAGTARASGEVRGLLWARRMEERASVGLGRVGEKAGGEEGFRGQGLITRGGSRHADNERWLKRRAFRGAAPC